ncbi:1-(5-phosphoribosyl)-5-[(5-phosphoribosylamino)methylideneamino]imidazole-4-carboxamide isomerase [Candidatus Roizmanbacteria bacterium]|nr:1-(5-phosphoribosyl)-5-[(5-phosphoribosylamino)methylideneamino]imidazole-4-carboxamide isomerase [Candidatus Roizmanbacteria bacterium]
MQIIPAIDIKDGNCVRLFQGDYTKETIYADSPVAMALKWKKQGAKMLHVIDLSGAKKGRSMIGNDLKQIIKKVTIPIQVGGGIRTPDSINQLIKSGVAKVILSTYAIENMILLKKIVDLYGDKIAVSLDVLDGKLMKNGWLEQSDITLTSTIKKLGKMGVETIIYTDITRDGTLTGPNYKIIEKVKKCTKMRLIIAGGVSSIEQINKLKIIGVDGVIIGKALYEEKIILKEVLKYVS